LFVCLLVYVFVCLFVCLCVCLRVCFFVCFLASLFTFFVCCMRRVPKRTFLSRPHEQRPLMRASRQALLGGSAVDRTAVTVTVATVTFSVIAQGPRKWLLPFATLH